MINFKKIICTIIIFFLYSIDINAKVIKDALFASVENKAITNSDILNEIKILLVITGQSYSDENREQLEASAVQSTIKRTIKLIEVEKFEDLKFNQNDLKKELTFLANNVNMDLDTLQNTFISNGIDFADIERQITIDLLWNSLIFKLYKDRLSINIDEINEQLKSIQNKKEIEEYLISEIIVKSVSQDKLQSKIDEIKNKIEIEGFEKVAMTLSISESAVKGGNLGWINENVLSDKIKLNIMNTPVGKISEPVLLQEGIIFFKIREKRKLQKFANLEEAKNQLVNVEKTKILRMHSLSHYDKLKKSVSIIFY